MVMMTMVNKDNQGVSLLEIVWKVVKAVINAWVKAVVQLHDVLYKFCAGRGTVASIMELKIAQ